MTGCFQRCCLHFENSLNILSKKQRQILVRFRLGKFTRRIWPERNYQGSIHCGEFSGHWFSQAIFLMKDYRWSTVIQAIKNPKCFFQNDQWSYRFLKYFLWLLFSTTCNIWLNIFFYIASLLSFWANFTVNFEQVNANQVKACFKLVKQELQLCAVYYFVWEVKNNARDQASDSHLQNEVSNLWGSSWNLYIVACWTTNKSYLLLEHLLSKCIRRRTEAAVQCCFVKRSS